MSSRAPSSAAIASLKPSLAFNFTAPPKVIHFDFNNSRERARAQGQQLLGLLPALLAGWGPLPSCSAGLYQPLRESTFSRWSQLYCFSAALPRPLRLRPSLLSLPPGEEAAHGLGLRGLTGRYSSPPAGSDTSWAVMWNPGAWAPQRSEYFRPRGTASSPSPGLPARPNSPVLFPLSCPDDPLQPMTAQRWGTNQSPASSLRWPMKRGRRTNTTNLRRAPAPASRGWSGRFSAPPQPTPAPSLPRSLRTHNWTVRCR